MQRSGALELELNQLDLRYEGLRRRDAAREATLLASLAAVGQQVPIVVVGVAQQRLVVIDGYKRVRGLRRLRQDLVSATRWDLDEPSALILARLLRARKADSALEQGWLLRELSERFGLDLAELSRRFDRSVSWVSRRVGLARELSEQVQEGVRCGQVSPHAAMKYLLPLARANEQDCLRLYRAIAPLRLSSRQVGRLYVGYQSGDERARHLLLGDPGLYLRAHAEVRPVRPSKPATAGEGLLADLRAVRGIARRAAERMRSGALLSGPQRVQVTRLLEQARADITALAMSWNEEEKVDARPIDQSDGAAPVSEGSRDAPDRSRPGDLPGGGADDPAQWQ